MKTSIKGTQTEQNIMTAFASETQSHCRYKFYAKAAKKEGYPQIAAIFKATGKNKHMHAMALYELLEGGRVEITASFPADKIGTVPINLAVAATIEHEKWSETYPEYAKVAEEEGFVHIATLFHHIMAVDTIQEELFVKLMKVVREKSLYASRKAEIWKCSKCGHRQHGTTPPEPCPLCGSPKEFFTRVCECEGECTCAVG